MGIYDGLLRVYRNLRLVHMNLRLVHMNLRLVHMNLRLVHMNALCFSSIVTVVLFCLIVRLRNSKKKWQGLVTSVKSCWLLL